MAFAEVIDVTNYDGTRGSVRYFATFGGAGEDQTDTILADISALAPAPASIKILSIDAILNGDLSVTFEFDADTDQAIDRFQGQTDVTFQIFRDYTRMPNNGVLPSNTGAAGFTGDLIYTTTGAASGDELNLFIVFEKSS